MTSYETRSQSRLQERSLLAQSKQLEDQSTSSHQDQKYDTSTTRYPDQKINPSSISTEQILVSRYGSINFPKLTHPHQIPSTNSSKEQKNSSTLLSQCSEILQSSRSRTKDQQKMSKKNFSTLQPNSTLSLRHEFLPSIEYQIPSYVTTSEESMRRIVGELGPGNNTPSQRMLETRSTSRTQTEPTSNALFTSSLASQDTPLPCKQNSYTPSNTTSTISRRTNWTLDPPELFHLKSDSIDLYIPRTSQRKLQAFSSPQEHGGK